MNSSLPLKTRDRILQVSLDQFNEHGERAVTTNHIAAALGISPGNLYYHFRNKSEIITQLLESYQTETLGLLSVPTDRPLTVQDKLDYFQTLSQQFWKYRFLHRDIHQLIETDDAIRQRYPAFARQVMIQGRAIYRGFVEAGLMNMSAAEIDALVINVWLVMTNWSNFLVMSGHIARNDAISERWVRQGLRQMVFLEGPYLNAENRLMYDTLLNTYGEEGFFEQPVTQPATSV